MDGAVCDVRQRWLVVLCVASPGGAESGPEDGPAARAADGRL